MKQQRRVIYKLCWNYCRGVYLGHRVCVRKTTALRLASRLPVDVWVGKVTRLKTKDITHLVKRKETTRVVN
jgi:hypothetical protein